MTPEEQELVAGLRATNASLRRKVQAAEDTIKATDKHLEEMSISRDEFRTLYMDAAEKLTRAMLILEKIGALEELKAGNKTEEQREEQHDAKLPSTVRGFSE